MHAAYQADLAAFRILLAEASVFNAKPDKMSIAYRRVLRAYEICANAHRRGGCTPGQLDELSKIERDLKELAA